LSISVVRSPSCVRKPLPHRLTGSVSEPRYRFTVVLVFAWVRRETTLRTAIFAAVLLGFSNLHVLYSRTGFVESTLVFFLALALWLWSLRERHGAFGFLSGVAFGLMLLTKVTAIYIIPGLALLAMMEAIRRTTSRRDAFLFLCGALLVGASYGIGFVAPNFGDWMNYNRAAGSDNEWPRQAADLFHSMVKILAWRFYSRTPVLTALTLVALVGLIFHISTAGLKSAIRRASSIEIAGGTLLIGYLLSVGIEGYQPERRFIPALFLMAPLSANVLDKGWRWFESVANPTTKLRAGGYFAVLFSLPATAIIDFKWAALGSSRSATLWFFKAIVIALFALISAALSRGRLPLHLKPHLVSASRFLFGLLFSVLSLGLVYQALNLWGFNADELRSGTFLATALLMAGSAIAVVVVLKPKPQAASLIIAAFISIEILQISTWLLQPTYTLQQANRTLAGLIKEGQTVVTNYETLLVSSDAKSVCYRPEIGFNIDAFERFDPDYILILRRDNWRDQSLGEMPSNEWPPPAPARSSLVATFDLCPTRTRGSRFSLELYGLKPEGLANLGSSEAGEATSNDLPR